MRRLLPWLVLSTMAACAPRQPARSSVETAPSASTTAARPSIQGLPHPALTRVGTATVADIAERALPSVVAIFATKAGAAPEIPVPPGHPLYKFFERRMPPKERSGVGSGVVVGRGMVLTNNHVVEGANQLRVVDSDNRPYDAVIVGTDPKTDLAVVRVTTDVDRLKPIELGDSGRLRLGDVVLAIGNPFGVGHTVTMGIVSAKGRANVGIVDYEDFIQTDAAINPGNSGGALVDMEGRLVGINTAILSRSGGYQGIGFAIPMSMAKPVLESLLATGRVSRGYLGVGIADLTEELADALGIKGRRGVLINSVSPDGPAARAGLKRGDIILAVAGQPVATANQLRIRIAAAGSAQTVLLSVLRGTGKEEQVRITLTELPDAGRAVAPTPSPAPGVAPGRAFDGLTVAELDEEARERLNVPKDVTGVLVSQVASGSTAARAGLSVGDLVIEVARKPVRTVAEFQAAWRDAPAKTTLVVYRRGRTEYIVVEK